MKKLRTFKQQAWNKQNDVIMTTDGRIFTEHKYGAEEALSNIILRLNAGFKHWKKVAEEHQKEIDRLKSLVAE